MGQVNIAPFRFLSLGPTSYEDRALPKMLRRAVEFAAAMCLPAATSTLVEGGKYREDVWQRRTDTRELETLDWFHTVTQTPLLQEPLSLSLAGRGDPALSHWTGGGIGCLSCWAQSLAPSQLLYFLPLCQRLSAHSHNNDGLSQYSVCTGENKCK